MFLHTEFTFGRSEPPVESRVRPAGKMRRPSLFFVGAVAALLFLQGLLLQTLFTLIFAGLISVAAAYVSTSHPGRSVRFALIGFSFSNSVLIRRFCLRAVKKGSDYVLISGTSTGFGKVIAHHLASLGYVVLAGVRKEADGANLVASAPGDAGSRIKPIILDVTKPAEIAAAVAEVREELTRAGGDAALVGVVNNAGIVQMDAVEILPEDKLRQQFEVNFFGSIALSKAFLPQLRRTVAIRGNGSARILFTGSVSADTVAPFFGAYAAAKIALDMMADTLRTELKSQGILVSVMQPGVFPTELVEKSSESHSVNMQAWLNSQDEEKIQTANLYKDRFKTVVDWYHTPAKSPLTWVSGEIDATLRVWPIFCPNKRMIGFDSYLVSIFIWWMPEEMLERFFTSTMKPGDAGVQKLVDLVVKYNPPYNLQSNGSSPSAAASPKDSTAKKSN